LFSRIADQEADTETKRRTSRHGVSEKRLSLGVSYGYADWWMDTFFERALEREKYSNLRGKDVETVEWR